MRSVHPNPTKSSPTSCKNWLWLFQKKSKSSKTGTHSNKRLIGAKTSLDKNTEKNLPQWLGFVVSWWCLMLIPYQKSPTEQIYKQASEKRPNPPTDPSFYTKLVLRNFVVSAAHFLGWNNQCSTGWWLNQPIWQICDSQIGSFPQF